MKAIEDYASSGNDFYSDEEYLDWLKRLGLSSFDSGGYTGDFGNERLAFLH